MPLCTFSGPYTNYRWKGPIRSSWRFRRGKGREARLKWVWEHEGRTTPTSCEQNLEKNSWEARKQVWGRSVVLPKAMWGCATSRGSSWIVSYVPSENLYITVRLLKQTHCGCRSGDRHQGCSPGSCREQTVQGGRFWSKVLFCWFIFSPLHIIFMLFSSRIIIKLIIFPFFCTGNSALVLGPMS